MVKGRRDRASGNDRHWSPSRRHTHHDLSIEPLCDLLPLQLLRRSYQPALQRPLIRRQHDCLEHLDALKPTLLSHRITFLQHQHLDLRVRAQVTKRSAGVLVRQRCAQVPFVREDDRDRLRRIWYGMYADV